MCKCKGWLKALFPKPRIPQKRYLVIIGLCAYFILKAYVLYTPDQSDDGLPDQLRGVVMDMFADDN